MLTYFKLPTQQTFEEDFPWKLKVELQFTHVSIFISYNTAVVTCYQSTGNMTLCVKLKVADTLLLPTILHVYTWMGF